MSRKIGNGLNLQGQRIINLGDPSSPADAANRAYVDNLVRGQVWKPAVRVASTATIDISSPGSTIDGVSMSSNDRVLLKNQTNPAANGVYVWTGPTVIMARSTDADTAVTLVPNTTVYVSEGVANADTQWTLTTDGPINLGVTALVFARSGGVVPYSAGNGLLLDGMEFSVDPHTGITVTGDGVGVDFSVVPRKFAINVGNGTLTNIPVTHNLGTYDVIVSVHDSTTFEEVWPDVIKTNANVVTLGFAVAPALNSYRAIVIG